MLTLNKNLYIKLENTNIAVIVIKKFINEDYLDNVYSYTGIDFNYFTDSDISNILNGTELYAPSDTDLENVIGEIAVAKYIEGYGDNMPTGMYLKIYFYNNVFDTLPNQDDGKLVLVFSKSGSLSHIIKKKSTWFFLISVK